MKDSKNIYIKVIDKYYDELAPDAEKNMSSEESILYNKLDLTLNKMDVLKTDKSILNVDILEIIKNGEIIKQNKNNFIEFIAFISLASLFISSLILLTSSFGELFFIYYELLTFIFIPILIFSFSKQLKIGGN